MKIQGLWATILVRWRDGGASGGRACCEKVEVRLKEDPLTLGCGGVWSLMHSMGTPVAKPPFPLWTALQQGVQWGTGPGGVSGSRAQRRNSVLSQDCLNPTSRQCLRTSSPSSTSPSHANDCDSLSLWLSPCPRIDAKPTRASFPPSIGSMPMRPPDWPSRPSSRPSPRENEKAWGRDLEHGPRVLQDPPPLCHRPAVFSCTPAASWRRRPPPVSAKRSWSASGPLVASPEPPLHVFFSYSTVQHRPGTRGLIPGRLCPAREGDQRLPTERHTTPVLLSGPGPSNTSCLSLLHASRLAVLLEEAPLPAALYACRACSRHRVRPPPPIPWSLFLRPARPTHSSPSQPTLNRGTGLFRLVRGPATTCDTPAPSHRPAPPAFVRKGFAITPSPFPPHQLRPPFLPFPSVPHTGRRRARDPTTVFR